MNRRAFLARLGLAGAAGSGLLGARGAASASSQPAGEHSGGHGEAEPEQTSAPANGGGHGANMAVGTVDHARNGFDPMDVLRDFDGGEVSIDATGRTTREYEFVAQEHEIEVAPGVFFPAWSYNGRVPGPTIRCTEGDRIVIRFANASRHPHTIHFHGIHSAAMDGVPGAGEIYPGETFTYDFVAEPFGTHLYHCHSLPLRQHIHRGLYGAFIVDPPGGRPPADELVLVMNAFDTNFDGKNEVYAANTVAFAYMDRPIVIQAGALVRAHVINMTEFDPVNSIHLHGNFFDLYRTGTKLQPDELTDVVSMVQAERHMLEFTYRSPGRFMVHAHQTEFTELGWVSFLEVVE